MKLKPVEIVQSTKYMFYFKKISCYSAIKKNEIMPFAAIWMDLEMIILSKSEGERQITYDSNFMWNLKN